MQLTVFVHDRMTVPGSVRRSLTTEVVVGVRVGALHSLDFISVMVGQLKSPSFGARTVRRTSKLEGY